MVQVGSGVPAKACRMEQLIEFFQGGYGENWRGGIDFIEMNETANILNNCTSNSLIVI